MFGLFSNFKKKKVGVALSSGGAKGLAHINVLEFLDEHDVEIDCIAGSSIGALIGAVYYSGTLTQFKNEFGSFTWKDIVHLVDPVFPRSGIISGKRIMKFLERFIDPEADIEDLPGKLAIISTDYFTGNPVVMRTGNLLQAVRGSISIPGIFVPHEYQGRILIDGGVANPIPVDIVRQMGATKIVAVNLHPSAEKLKGAKKLKKLKNLAFKRKRRTMGNRIASHIKINASGWFKFITSALSLEDVEEDTHKGRELPSIIDVFMQSMEVMEYMNTYALLRYNKPTVLIEPEVREISGLDFDSGSEVLQIGQAAVEKNRKKLLRKIVR
ncbi:MAG: patatin-like phospholipase family protein [Spirochaetes bacterium]|jgi:NTE family protein|nr:patatin-like phospholipase family protein [Spirochaetota bacterium]